MTRSNHSFVGGLLALCALLVGACGDDDEVTAEVDAGTGDGGFVAADAGPVASELPAYIVPGEETMAAIAIDRDTGVFYVDSASSGKIYRGTAGADTEVTLELFADLTSAGIARGGHIALTPDGTRLLMLTPFGSAPQLRIVDLDTRTLERTIDVPGATGGLAGLQDVVASPDSTLAYATNSAENVIQVFDLVDFTTESFPISSEFPFISDASQGFINATGIAIADDGQSLIVVHIIDKRLYRISLRAETRGDAVLIDTTPYNVSGNGLFLGPDGDLLEVASDELRIYRFTLDPTLSRGAFATRYASDVFEQGLTYAVSHEERVLVLNGSGVSPTVGGGMMGGALPAELSDACVGKSIGDACSATIMGFAIDSTCSDAGGVLACIPAGMPGVGGGDGGVAAMPRYPIRVLQLPL